LAVTLPATDTTAPTQPWLRVNATRESDTDTQANSDGRTNKPDVLAFEEDTFHNTATRHD
jgi:hypothetical protein